MRSKSLAQLLLFIIITAFWFKIAWPLMTKEALAVGAVGGLLVHWAVTNKGNRAIVLIEPGTSGWRVMMYDMMLVAFLVALWQGHGTALLDALKSSVQNSALLLALVGGIGIDYGVGG